MTEPDFYPTPAPPKRGILRWLILTLHTCALALLIYLIPSLTDAGILDSNAARIIIPIWAGILIAHLMLVVVLDVWEDIVRAFTERRRRREFERQQKRQNLLRRISAENNTADAEIYVDGDSQ